jgi:hypothetical protein
MKKKNDRKKNPPSNENIRCSILLQQNRQLIFVDEFGKIDIQQQSDSRTEIIFKIIFFKKKKIETKLI